MRIVAGLWRGRALSAPAGTATRPTADRMRQALFDRLAHAPWAEGSLAGRVLDGFAGTGALGLEALSRGAERAWFIEQDKAALAQLHGNIRACGATAQSKVFAADVLRPPAGEACGLVMLDPPYGQDLVPRAVLALRAAGWMAPGGLVVAEFGRADPVPAPEALGLAAVLGEQCHGAARVVIWR